VGGLLSIVETAELLNIFFIVFHDVANIIKGVQEKARRISKTIQQRDRQPLEALK